MKLSRGEKIYRLVCILGCTLVALLCLYPLLYTVFLSFCSDQEWVDKGGMLLGFPSDPTFAGYIKIFASGSRIIKSIGISVAKTLLGTVLSLIITGLTAYVLSRRDLPGKKPFLYIVLFTILFGGGLIPGYLTVQSLGLINTFWVLVIPCLFSGWNMLVFKQFFENIPREVEESAEMDGVGPIGMFFYIILPMSKPVFAAIGLFTMVGLWNSWFDAWIYIDQAHNSLWPLQLFTRVAFDSSTALNESGLDFLISSGTEVNSTSMRMALTIVTMLPILIVYPFFQKHFAQGVYMGAVKE